MVTGVKFGYGVPMWSGEGSFELTEIEASDDSCANWVGEARVFDVREALSDLDGKLPGFE